jgi:hypothetical protein
MVRSYGHPGWGTLILCPICQAGCSRARPFYDKAFARANIAVDLKILALQQPSQRLALAGEVVLAPSSKVSI